jgi:predicted dehydrogenase
VARPKLAIVGCGAVAQLHLMAVDSADCVDLAAFVDKDVSRAQKLADERGVDHALADYRDVPGVADCAIVALPHHLHAEVASYLLEHGVHVLTEKPMAMTTAQCDRMIAAAASGGTTLAVGVARRFYDASRFVKRALDQEWLGKVVTFEVQEGAVYGWPVASDFMFRREAGGGVLLDTGAHVLDRLCFWLGDFASVEYFDDAEGGVEADCLLELVMQSGAKGSVELSRTRDLRNTWILRCERGTIELDTGFHAHVRIQLDGHPFGLDGRVMRDSGVDEDPLDCFTRSFANFVESFQKGLTPLGSGPEARRSVALMEKCREVRAPLALDWASWTA